jgi:hypothetical protein
VKALKPFTDAFSESDDVPDFMEDSESDVEV